MNKFTEKKGENIMYFTCWANLVPKIIDCK